MISARSGARPVLPATISTSAPSRSTCSPRADWTAATVAGLRFVDDGVRPSAGDDADVNSIPPSDQPGWRAQIAPPARALRNVDVDVLARW